jgi:tryptophan-rich sensory protein
MSRLALQILWPAFLMAGVLELLVFALVDPSDLHWFGGAPVQAPRQAVYTLAFLAFWAVIAVAGAITAVLLRRADEINQPS